MMTQILNTIKGFPKLLTHVIGESSHQMMGTITVPKRSVIYYTHSKGQLRTVRAAVQRFYRLSWGAWIRPRAGRHKHLWKKPFDYRWWAKQHVFCNKEQCEMLDRMTSARYKIPTYFVDDIYEPYQNRNNFPFVPLGKSSVSTSYIKTLHQYAPKGEEHGRLFKEKPVHHPKQPLIMPQKGGRKFFKKPYY